MSEEFDTQVRDDGTACTKYEIFSGKGTRIKPNGIKYIGEWKDGGYDGNGTITYPNGTKYIGEFKGRDFNGNGTMTYSDGHKYSGEFVDGKFNGNGTLTHPNETKYIGEFKDGNKHGKGTLYTKMTGETITGIWESNKLVKTISTTNVLQAMRNVFQEHCTNPITLEPWEDKEIIVLHNPDGKMFDVSKPIDDERLCNFIFTEESYYKGKGKNPFTGVKMLEKDVKIYQLSIIDPPKSKSPVKSPMKSPAKSPAKSKAKSLKTQSLRLKSISKKNSTRRTKSI